MESSSKKAKVLKNKRALRVRRKITGSQERPRLCVVKTNRYIYAQLIDDAKMHTVASMSTNSKEWKTREEKPKSKEAAKAIGQMLAEKAKGLGISNVVFDRGPFKYHGILAEVANAVREAGVNV